MDLSAHLRDVHDFPKPGIVFKDISPLLANPAAMQSRGFLFGMPLAMKLGVGFTPIRKPGKLPWRTNRIEYSLEYGTDALEIHQDGIVEGHNVLLVDDLLATGGTMKAACDLVSGIGGVVAGCLFVVELGFLDGRKLLEGQTVDALIGID